MVHVTKWNYIAPIRLFWHYLVGCTLPMHIKVDKVDDIPKYSAMYLALGHFNYSSGRDVYDFNEGEWPRWLINIGDPYKITWDIE